MGRYGSLDYSRLTKTSFLLGLVLFAVGSVGQITFSAVPGTPTWELTLLFDLEAIGLVGAFFSPLLFSIVLPLTERSVRSRSRPRSALDTEGMIGGKKGPAEAGQRLRKGPAWLSNFLNFGRTREKSE
jgi:MFS family permease